MPITNSHNPLLKHIQLRFWKVQWSKGQLAVNVLAFKFAPSTSSSEYRVKQSHYRPAEALKFPGGWGSQMSRHSAHEGDKDVSPKHHPPLASGNIPGTHDWVKPRAVVQPEGLCQWKIPMTTSGIEPVTFRLVAQFLNQLRHHAEPSRAEPSRAEPSRAEPSRAEPSCSTRTEGKTWRSWQSLLVTMRTRLKNIGFCTPFLGHWYQETRCIRETTWLTITTNTTDRI
jgi:hypothetical protein